MKKLLPNFRLNFMFFLGAAGSAAALIILFYYRELFFCGARVIRTTSVMNKAVDIPFEQHRDVIFYLLIAVVLLSFVDGLFCEFGKNAGKVRYAFSGPVGVILTLAVTFGCSVLSFYEIELINNYYIARMETTYVWLNIAITFVLYLVIIFAVNSVSFGLQIGSVFFVFWGVMNMFVQKFRGSPLQWVDFSSIRTAAGVAGNYSYDPNWEAVACVVLTFAVFAFCGHRHIKANFRTIPFKIVSRGISAGLLFAFYLVIFRSSFLADTGVWLRDWQPWYTYRLFGVESGFFAFAKASFPEAPDSYSGAEVKRIISESEEENADLSSDASLEVPENIICIMNESFSDLRIYPNFDTDVEMMPFIDSLKDNTQSGDLLVSVKGGTTSNTEYEFLTGNSCVLSPSTVVYTSFIKNDQYSLARTLAEQGYTSIAMHPYKAKGWSRTTVYPRMGFEEFLSIENSYEGAETLRGYVSDRGDYEEIIRQVENKEEGEKLFLFNVTMQNHGGYTSDSLESTVHVENYHGENSAEADQYVSLIRLSDEAIEELIEYFSESDQKTLICFFGDHQPEIGDDLWEYCLGNDLDSLTFEEQELQYVTKYFIWANYDIPEAEEQTMSVNYLGSHLLSLTGLEAAGYNRFLLGQQEEIPVMNAYGCIDTEGNVIEWGTEDVGEETEKQLEKYKCLIYNELTAGGGRDRTFYLPVIPDG